MKSAFIVSALGSVDLGWFRRGFLLLLCKHLTLTLLVAIHSHYDYDLYIENNLFGK